MANRASANLITEEMTRRVDELLAKMTVAEKVGQLVLRVPQIPPEQAAWGIPALEEQVRQGACGNVFNVRTVANVRKLQNIAVHESRLGIPLLLGDDVIHGYKTIFPIPLGSAASWDLKAIENAARIAAREASAAGINWTFAPMVDIARDPRWGRIAEGAGEDPYLGSEIARAAVRGFQGTALTNSDSVLACVKHFAAYGAAQAGRDYNTVDISERTLREIYLPPFKAAIDEGALSVMSAFDELNGVPATANSMLMREILRNEWGFQGLVVSDYTAVNELVNHGIAGDEAEAGSKALAAGVDMDMQGFIYNRYLAGMLKSGAVTEKQLDEAVRRVLLVKAALGLFDDPFRGLSEEREKRLDNYPADHLATARELAGESMVLLKNDHNVLPLKQNLKLAIIGPLADSRADLLGPWHDQGQPAQKSILAGIKEAISGGSVVYAKGCDLDSKDWSKFAAAVEVARKADVVVMVLGENADMSGESSSRTSLGLPGVQTELLQQIKTAGKPVVLVLLNGRPLVLEQETGLADAMLEAWFPGTEGAGAVADVLFGARNPSGRLTVTFPRNPGQVPIFYNSKNTGRPINPVKPTEKFRSSYLDSSNEPLFPFGFGLSYTKFSYSNLQVDKPKLRPGETAVVSVEVANTGATEGVETAQLYLHQLVASVGRPVRELKGFQQIRLKPGEKRRIDFEVGGKELTFLRGDMTWGTEPGPVDLFIGSNSRDAQAVRVELLAR